MKISNLTRTERCKIFRDVQIKAKNSYELLFLDILNKKNITFYYQYIISPYILDFYLPAYGLAIEIDGEIHNKKAVEIRDFRREEYIASLGIRVMRYNTSINKETPLQFIDCLLNNFQKISKNLRRKLNSKIDKVYQILDLKNFNIKNVRTYQLINKKHACWKRNKQLKSKLKRLVKKYGKEKALIKADYYKRRQMPERFKPKLPALYTMKIKRTKNAACTI